MIADSVIRRISIARYLLELAKQEMRSEKASGQFAAILLVQDAIETFLFAAADHLNVAFEKRTEFAQYLDKINEKISPKELSFRVRLIQLNKTRISSKHDALLPNFDELKSLLIVAEEFLFDATKKIFNKDFVSVNLVDLVDQEDTAALLKEAQQAFECGDFVSCLICCRRMIYSTFEVPYDVYRFADGKGNLGGGLLSSFPFSKAPTYAQSEQYIREKVHTPFDYIVLDHARIDAELVKESIDPAVYWNIRRLTPEVYQRPDKSWIHKNDLHKLDESGIGERAAYVLDKTIEISVTLARRRRALRSANVRVACVLKPKRAQIPVYQSADKNGPILGNALQVAEKILSFSSTPGLKDDGIYWEALTQIDGPVKVAIGYFLNDDVEATLESPN